MPPDGLDPYRFPGMRGLPEEEAGEPPWLRLPYPRPTPTVRPAPELPSPSRRLDLQACLTIAGVTLVPEDLHAIEVLSGLDETTFAAVRRWIDGSY
ncbi:hypothetical protein [Streptomyces sp. NPDC058279]|uniref:hypothetical protein n=1 Tax=Streptomyces sp. NPDC058279 TaxID=3346418 RepID=UPI0036E4E2AE